MIEITPAQAQHFQYIVPTQEQSAEYAALWKPGYIEGLLSGTAFTAWARGRCLGASGVFQPPEWVGRGEAWALFAPGAGEHLLPIVRFMRVILYRLPLTRIDMLVAEGNGNGHVLAKLCGFEYEARLEKYHPSGVDAHMYKRIRGK
jgi:hypothetical protein